MLSSKLIQLIETHWEPITARILDEIRRDERLVHLRGLPESEMRQRAQDILKNLGHWLVGSNREELAGSLERLGRLRYEEAMPLQEVVLGQLTIKREMIEFVHEQGLDRTPVDLYAEEELEHAVDRFFDNAIYHLIRGYEEARQPRAAAARAR